MQSFKGFVFLGFCLLFFRSSQYLSLLLLSFVFCIVFKCKVLRALSSWVSVFCSSGQVNILVFFFCLLYHLSLSTVLFSLIKVLSLSCVLTILPYYIMRPSCKRGAVSM